MKELKVVIYFGRRIIAQQLCKAVKLLFLAAFISISLLANADVIAQQDNINNISYSPDSTKLMFDGCSQGKCAIHIYDLKTGDLGYYKAPEGEFWSMGRFSHDGNRIVFSSTPLDAEGQRVLENMQIAVMKLDSSEVEIITHGEGAKIYPSFSHSGEKIIYVWGRTVTKASQWISESLKRKIPASDYDLHEVDVRQHHQIQLTDFRFGVPPNRPFYMPNDEQFAFSAEYPKRYSTSEPILKGSEISVRINAYKQKYGRNHLYVLSPGEAELVPYLVTRKETTQDPVLDAKGNLYFKDDRSMLYMLDGNRQMVAQWSMYPDEWKDKNIETYSKSYDLAPNGLQVVYVWSKVEGNMRIPKVGVLSLKDNSFRWVAMPAKANRIND